MIAASHMCLTAPESNQSSLVVSNAKVSFVGPPRAHGGVIEPEWSPKCLSVSFAYVARTYVPQRRCSMLCGEVRPESVCRCSSCRPRLLFQGLGSDGLLGSIGAMFPNTLRDC